MVPFRLGKPWKELSSDAEDDDDNAVDWEAVPVIQKKKRRVSDTSGMGRQLRADGGSSYWGSRPGKPPATEGMVSHQSSAGDSRTSDTRGTMVSAVYMREAGPSTYKSAMESDKAYE